MLDAVQEAAAAGEPKERLSQTWRDFGAKECGAYSPLYAAICRSVADDPDLLALAAAAPPTGQQPNVLLAAVHYLVLSGLADPLAEIYAGRADPGPGRPCSVMCAWRTGPRSAGSSPPGTPRRMNRAGRPCWPPVSPPPRTGWVSPSACSTPDAAPGLTC